MLRRSPAQRRMANVKCDICGDRGHVASDCKQAAEQHKKDGGRMGRAAPPCLEGTASHGLGTWLAASSVQGVPRASGEAKWAGRSPM